jgi:hypothetical protein
VNEEFLCNNDVRAATDENGGFPSDSVAWCKHRIYRVDFLASRKPK